MKRFTLPLVILGVVAGVLWRFPPFHIVLLAEVEAAKREEAFDAAGFARKFWEERLTPARETAADAQKVVAAIQTDPQAARVEFGRTVGVSRGYFYFLRGEGQVVSVADGRIGLSLEKGPDADVVLLVGKLFGNAVRDATGLVDASDFPNSQHFNAISQELNRLVETEVVPSVVKLAKIGQQLRFVGCAEVKSEKDDLRPLKLVPLSVTLTDPQATP